MPVGVSARSTIAGWDGRAYNQEPDSPNEIHGDELARRYGFKGGLVPGVTVSAYLLHPAVLAWGLDYLTRGRAHVRVLSPLYDGEYFEVDILEQSDAAYGAQLRRRDGTVCARADVALAEEPPAPPRRRGDPLVAIDYAGPPASRAVWEQLQRDGCKAQRFYWQPGGRMASYLRDESAMPGLHTGSSAWANSAFILGISNWLAAANASMNPWLHLETRSQNYCAIAADTEIIAEMRVADLFEKKGHEFVDVVVDLFDAADDRCLTTIDLRAIYRLRGL